MELKNIITDYSRFLVKEGLINDYEKMISIRDKYLKVWAEKAATEPINCNISDVSNNEVSVCDHHLKFRWLSNGNKLCEECGEEFDIG